MHDDRFQEARGRGHGRKITFLNTILLLWVDRILSLTVAYEVVGGDEVVEGAASDGARRRPRGASGLFAAAWHRWWRRTRLVLLPQERRRGGASASREDGARDRAQPPPPRAGIRQEIGLRLRRRGRQRGWARSGLVRLRLARESGRRLASASAGEDGHDPAWSASASRGNPEGYWPPPPPARTDTIRTGTDPPRTGTAGATGITGGLRESRGRRGSRGRR